MFHFLIFELKRWSWWSTACVHTDWNWIEYWRLWWTWDWVINPQRAGPIVMSDECVARLLRCFTGSILVDVAHIWIQNYDLCNFMLICDELAMGMLVIRMIRMFLINWWWCWWRYIHSAYRVYDFPSEHTDFELQGVNEWSGDCSDFFRFYWELRDFLGLLGILESSSRVLSQIFQTLSEPDTKQKIENAFGDAAGGAASASASKKSQKVAESLSKPLKCHKVSEVCKVFESPAKSGKPILKSHVSCVMSDRLQKISKSLVYPLPRTQWLSPLYVNCISSTHE